MHARKNLTKSAGSLAAALLAATALGAASAAYADSTSTPAKVSAATSVSNVDLTTNPVISVSLTSTKRKNKLLEVHALTTGFPGTATLSGSVTVNGVTVEPGLVEQHCGGSCTLSATWWLDIDQADAAAPGTLKNKLPLSVSFFPSAGNGAGNVAVLAKLVAK